MGCPDYWSPSTGMKCKIFTAEVTNNVALILTFTKHLSPPPPFGICCFAPQKFWLNFTNLVSWVLSVAFCIMQAQKKSSLPSVDTPQTELDTFHPRSFHGLGRFLLVLCFHLTCTKNFCLYVWNKT